MLIYLYTDSSVLWDFYKLKADLGESPECWVKKYAPTVPSFASIIEIVTQHRFITTFDSLPQLQPLNCTCMFPLRQRIIKAHAARDHEHLQERDRYPSYRTANSATTASSILGAIMKASKRSALLTTPHLSNAPP